jgi:hypothetical protein
MLKKAPFGLPLSLFSPVVFLAIFLFFTLQPRSGVAAVDLLYFYATPESDGILLEWETAQEIDNAGFYIQRHSETDDDFVRIGEFIPSGGDPFAGQYYSTNDNTAIVGVLYYYRLEMIDASGLSEFSEPDSAQISGPTPTSTPTEVRTETTTPTQTIQATSGSTATRTETRTPTETPRRTRTNTPVPTITRSPTPRLSATKTPGPTQTYAMVPTETPTPTTTLGVLPEFSQVFPLPSITATVTATDEIQAASSPTQMSIHKQPISGRLQLLVVIVILLWLFLAGFLIFYLRKLTS